MANKYQTIVIKGLHLIFPKLNRPDTKFNEHGTYECKGALSEDDAAPYIDELRKAYKDYVGKNHKAKPSRSDKGFLFFFEEDEDGEHTGRVIFKISARNVVSKKTGKLWDRRPLVTDAMLKPMPDSVMIGGGTIANVKCEIETRPTQNGPSVRLVPTVVQITSLQEWVPGGANLTGMEADDEGYVADHSMDDMEPVEGGAQAPDVDDDDY